MKELKFKTSKGEFLVVDENELPKIDKIIISNDSSFIKLSEITEEQAGEIVDKPTSDGFYPRYGNFEGNNKMWYCLKDAPIESLHSLLKSKGVHLFENPYSIYDMSTWHDAGEAKHEAEQKTFYNPYIFKL